MEKSWYNCYVVLSAKLPIINAQEVGEMLMLIVMGYVLTAAAFYAYIVTTAGQEEMEQSSQLIDMGEWQRNRDEQARKAA